LSSVSGCRSAMFSFPNYQLNALSLICPKFVLLKFVVCSCQFIIKHLKWSITLLLKRCCFSEISKQGSAKSQMRSSDKIVYKFSDENSLNTFIVIQTTIKVLRLSWLVMIFMFLFKKNNLLINSISIFYIVKQNSGRAFIIADSLPLQFSFKK
jgi:hypothetical protein